MYVQNVAAPVYFQLTKTSDGTPLTGATVSVSVSKDGAAQAGGAGSVSELGGGQYVYSATSGEMNPTKVVAFLFAATGGISVTVAIPVVPANIPVNVLQWNSHNVPAENVNGVPLVDLKYVLGTISPATAGFVGIDWGHVNNAGATVVLSATTLSLVTTVTTTTTATNLTNAPTAGDLTATMKTSVQTAAAAAITAASLATASGLSSAISGLQNHGDSAWATATGFALASVWTSGLANTISTNLDTTISSRLASGDVTVGAYASGEDPATLLASSFSSLQTHGDTSWTTASGFATSGDLAAVASNVTTIVGKLPTNTIADETLVIQATNAIMNVLTGTGVNVAQLGGNNVSLDADNNLVVSLSARGLRVIDRTFPSGASADWTFDQILMALFARAYGSNEAPLTGNGSWTTKTIDGSTVICNQPITITGSTQTLGAAP